jgi:hypothetical protein
MRRAAESDAEGSDVKREGEQERESKEERKKAASDPEPVSAYQRRKKQASAGEHVCVFFPERLDPSIPLEASMYQSEGRHPKPSSKCPQEI